MKGSRHGYGILRDKNGYGYFGEWKDDQREGNCYEKFPVGDEYFGQYKNDE